MRLPSPPLVPIILPTISHARDLFSQENALLLSVQGVPPPLILFFLVNPFSIKQVAFIFLFLFLFPLSSPVHTEHSLLRPVEQIPCRLEPSELRIGRLCCVIGAGLSGIEVPRGGSVDLRVDGDEADVVGGVEESTKEDR